MAERRRIDRHFLILAVTLIAVIVGTAACGGGSSSNSSTNAPGKTVSVSEKEFVIVVNGTDLHNGNGDATVPTGMVTFNVKNTGNVTHAFEIQGNGVDEKTGNIDPGGTVNLTVKLAAGTYEVFCPIPGHKEAGMDGKVTAQ